MGLVRVRVRVRVMVKVRVKVRFRVQKYLGFDPWRHSGPFIWETYPNLQCVDINLQSISPYGFLWRLCRLLFVCGFSWRNFKWRCSACVQIIEHYLVINAALYYLERYIVAYGAMSLNQYSRVRPFFKVFEAQPCVDIRRGRDVFAQNPVLIDLS